MSFRHRANDPSANRAWQNWIAEHRRELIAIGLPPEVCLDADHWRDFLENGHLHLHRDGTGWAFDQLSHKQLAALARFLAAHHSAEVHAPPILNWINARLAAVTQSAQQSPRL